MEQLSDFDRCAGRLKALADPKRLRIVTNLFAGPKTVSEITEALGDDMVLVSHHLGILRASMIVVATKRGRFVEYALHPEVKGQVADANCKQIDFGCCKLDIS